MMKLITIYLSLMIYHLISSFTISISWSYLIISPYHHLISQSTISWWSTIFHHLIQRTMWFWARLEWVTSNRSWDGDMKELAIKIWYEILISSYHLIICLIIHHVIICLTIYHLLSSHLTMFEMKSWFLMISQEEMTSSKIWMTWG